MPSERSPNRSSDDILDTTPLLGSPAGSSDGSNSGRRSIQRSSLRQAARFFRQASSRRMMREPSMVVREAAAEQLESRQSDWAYSKPVVILDIIWNFAFVIVAATVLVLSYYESPNTPLRLWILGYALQCVLHVVCVCFEYKRRQRRQQGFNFEDEGIGSSGNLSSGGRDDSGQYARLGQVDEESTSHPSQKQTIRKWGRSFMCILFLLLYLSSVAKHLESANTMFSFIWWIIGFYWVSSGGQALAHESPQLYWLCIVFLGFDVFFVVFCVALACIIGIAVCCCLPCIIALLYAVADQEGASKEDIEKLSKFKFRKVGNNEKLIDETQGPLGGIMTECGTDSPIENVLPQEDAECCICLSAYDDGVELRQLPCGHHFHCCCVDKWLFINATCPLCKYNILKSSGGGDDEV